jgi:hypothetical protein
MNMEWKWSENTLSFPSEWGTALIDFPNLYLTIVWGNLRKGHSGKQVEEYSAVRDSGPLSELRLSQKG